MTFREEKYTHCPYCSQSRIHKDMGMVWEYHGSSLPEGGLTIGSLWNHPWFVEELMVWQNVSWRLWPASVWMSFWPRRSDNEQRRAAVGCRWYGRVAANDSLWGPKWLNEEKQEELKNSLAKIRWSDIYWFYCFRSNICTITPEGTMSLRMMTCDLLCTVPSHFTLHLITGISKKSHSCFLSRHPSLCDFRVPQKFPSKSLKTFFLQKDAWIFVFPNFLVKIHFGDAHVLYTPQKN